MVQTYGIANEQVGESSNSEHQSESSALLGGGRDAAVKKASTQLGDGHATMASSVSNLINTIIGSGMLTFPLAMASTGIIPGILTCMLSGGVAAFGLYLLSICASKTHYRRASFFAISQLTFPRASAFLDAAIAVKCFGVSISYLIIIKGLMPNVVLSLYHDLTSEDTNPPEWAVNDTNWLIIFMIILVPLAFLRKIDSLRHTSYIALFSVVYLLAIVVKCFIWPLKGMPTRGEVHLIRFSPSFVSNFPVQVFAFTCAQNLFPIYNEVVSNTQERMNLIIGTAIGTATLTYEVIALLGYLTFGSIVGPNIIAMYPSTSLFIAIGQAAIVILVLFSYPLQILPCRDSLDKVFHSFQAQPPKAITEDGDLDNFEDPDHAHIEMTPLKHTLLTSAIVGLGFIIALFVDDLRIVLSFVGSTGSTTISFILPGLFYWKLTRDDPTVSKRMNRSALLLAVYGFLVMIFCLSYNIYQLRYPNTAGIEE